MSCSYFGISPCVMLLDVTACLTDRLSDWDGHLSTDTLTTRGPDTPWAQTAQGTAGTAHSQISFTRTDGAEFSPHVSFSSSTNHFCAASWASWHLLCAVTFHQKLNLKTAQITKRRSRARGIPEAFCRSRHAGAATKRFHISSTKTGSEQLLPLIFVSCCTPRKGSAKQISVLSGTLRLNRTAGRANQRRKGGKPFQCSDLRLQILIHLLSLSSCPLLQTIILWSKSQQYQVHLNF